MKSLLMGMALALAVTLGGCQTAGVDARVDQVVEVTKKACGFVPLAKTITAIFSTGMNSVFDVAQSICNAVTTNPLSEGQTPGFSKAGTVNGVVVEGSFVQRRPRR